MKRAFLVFGLCAGLLGCQRSGFDQEPTEVKGLLLTTSETSYEAWFTAGDDLLRAPASKVTEANFQALDTIGVFIYSGALGNGPYHSTNMLYYTQDGTPDASTAPKWTAATAMGGALLAGTAYSSTAYYPYRPTATNASAVVHSVVADQSAAAVAGSARALERSDFMWAPPVAVANPATAPEAKMVFQHLLTKLVVSLQVPSMIDGVAVTKLNSVAIKNLNTTASIHLGTGALSSLTNVKEIKPRPLSGNGNPGTVSTYEAVVVSQTAASGVVLVEVRCQTGSGEKVANYFPAAAGLVLGSGKKITLTLTSAADIAVTSELDLVTGQAYNNLPLKLKVASGVAWTLAAPAGSWISLATASGGTYGATITGTGTGVDQTVYVNASANTGAGATPRQAVLTLSATLAGVPRTVTYTAVQNYSQPVVGFPEPYYIMMEGENYQLPAVVGNSNWYIKAENLPQGVRLSRRNVLWSALTAADTVEVWKFSTNINAGTNAQGYMVSGNYYNSNGALYVVADPLRSDQCKLMCNGVDVSVDARFSKVTDLVQAKSIWIAKGNLVADGTNKCKVGNPFDCGLYFQFGSLVGWSGGANGDGTGEGWPALALKVLPKECKTHPGTWQAPGGSPSSFDKYYFSYILAPYDKDIADIGVFDVALSGDSGTGDLSSGRYAALGVGDPCTYYLGTQFRTVLSSELNFLVRGIRGTPTAAATTYVQKQIGAFTVLSFFNDSPLFLPAGYRKRTEGSFDESHKGVLDLTTSTRETGGSAVNILAMNGIYYYPHQTMLSDATIRRCVYIGK